MSQLRTFLLALALFPVALAAQEVSHLAAYSFFGIPSSLLVTPWRFHFFNLWVFGLHAAPAVTPPVAVHVAVDFLGPALPIVSLLLLRAAVPPGVAATALLANILALAFFAVIEFGFALTAFAFQRVIDVLLWPEVNYGAVLVIMIAVTLLGSRGSSRGITGSSAPGGAAGRATNGRGKGPGALVASRKAMEVGREQDWSSPLLRSRADPSLKLRSPKRTRSGQRIAVGRRLPPAPCTDPSERTPALVGGLWVSGALIMSASAQAATTCPVFP